MDRSVLAVALDENILSSLAALEKLVRIYGSFRVLLRGTIWVYRLVIRCDALARKVILQRLIRENGCRRHARRCHAKRHSREPPAASVLTHRSFHDEHDEGVEDVCPSHLCLFLSALNNLYHSTNIDSFIEHLLTYARRLHHSEGILQPPIKPPNQDYTMAPYSPRAFSGRRPWKAASVGSKYMIVADTDCYHEDGKTIGI